MKRNDLGLLRLVAQHLAGPPLDSAAEAVAHLGAVQAQDLPGALTSVALRTASGSEVAVRAALEDGSVVRSWPMRGTLHFTTAADIGWICELTEPRSTGQAATRHRELGINEAMYDRAREAIVDLLTTSPATRTQIQSHWQGQEFTAVPQRLSHLLGLLSTRGVLVQTGPLSANQPVFRLAEQWIADPTRPADREQALQWITARYFLGHGPATLRDLARWTGLTLTELKPAAQALTGQTLARTEIDEVTHWHDPELPDLFAEHRRQARQRFWLPGFDELVLGYADRTCTIAPEHASTIVPGNNGMFMPTVIEGGIAVGTWRRGRPGELIAF